MNSRKIIYGLLILSMLLSLTSVLTGCGKDKSLEKKTETNVTPPKIEIVLDDEAPSPPPNAEEPDTDEPSAEPEPVLPEAKKEYAWVLVETVQETYQADIDNTNKNGVYEVSASASPGSYTYSWKYVGESDDYPEPDMVHGESYATQLTISVPPDIIKGGEMVNLHFKLAFTDVNLSYFDGRGSARADWGNLKFKNATGKTHFDIYSSVKYSEKNVLSVSDTISAVIPDGYSEGDRERLWIGGGSSGTNYFYEWKQIP